jgi:hypothetical protein
MTLHHAIEATIKKYNRPMTAVEIALELNKSRAYVKKDGADLKSSTIEARVQNYMKIFTKEGSLIGLKDGNLKAEQAEQPKVVLAQKNENRHTLKVANPALAMKVLLNVKNFKPAAGIDKIVPDQSGIYIIRVQRSMLLPKPFREELEARKHNLLYIGVAKESIKKELLERDLKAAVPSEFFSSLGAILGYRPQEGSLADQEDKANFTFSEADQTEIIKWMTQNLRVNWLCMEDGWEVLESQLILDEHPLINMENNPNAYRKLKALHAKCLKTAGGE